MDELVKVVVDDSQSTDALNRIAAAGARADTSINNLGQTIDKTTQATRSASGAAASNATSVQNQASAFQRLQSTVTGAASSFQRLASTTSGTLGSAFSRLQTVAGNAFSAIIAYANNAGGSLNNFNRNLQQNQRSMDNLWRLASATAAANIFGAMWDKATAGISAYIDRMTGVQRTMSMLTVVTPTGQQGEFDYIMKTADKYGVRLRSLADNYSKLAISAREANVPQETMRKLFEGTSIGARVMHMSVSQADLAFQALTQMMSKGIVSTEELRRQFAERLPGAIHATAKELGVTYEELDNFIKKGKALSDKFIPYLANALINSFGKGIGPAASALDAELNRIHNSFDKFFKQVYDAGGDKGPAAAIRALNEKLNNPEIAKSFARWVDSISKEVTRFIQLITMEDIEKGANTFITVLKAIGDMAIFAANSVKWLSENLGIVGGLLGAYMGAKIGFLVGGLPGMAVGAAISGLGGAVGGLAMGGAGTPGTQLQPSKANSQMLLENQLRLQASGSTNGTQFNKADLDLLSGLPQTKAGALPELLPLKKVGPGTTLDDLLGGATGGSKNGSGAKVSSAAAERALEKQEDLMAKLHGLNKNFAEEWDTLNTVFNSAANKKQQFLPLEELISLQQELLEQQPFMKEIRKDEAISLKYQMKELDEYNKAQQNLLDDKKKMAEESMMDAQRMEDEAVAWQYAKDNAVDLATGIQMMAQARAQDNYESALAAGASGETLLALQKELEARNRILNQTKANDIRDTAEEEYRKLAKRQANFWADTFQNADRAGRSIFQSLARGGDDAFKQVGETIKTSIIDVLYQMTAQKWMISIGTSIFGDGFAAAAARAVGDGGVGGGGVGISSLNSPISSTIGNAFSKFAGSSVGQSLGLSNTTYAAGPMGPVAPGTELTATGQQMSQALGVVGDTLAGYAMGSMARSLISNGYSAGKGMDNFQKAGIAVGSAIGGPIGGAIVGAGAGVFNQLFGRKLKDSGIQGTFGGQSGFEGESYEFYKGGLLRSDKTKTKPLDEEVRKSLGDAFGAMRAEVGTFATLLGLETDRLAGFTTSIKISTKGLDDKAAQEKIQEALATANNELAEQVIGSWVSTTEQAKRYFGSSTVTTTSYTPSEFAKDGEKAIDTLRRLATSLSTVNAIWENLGFTLYEGSLAGADAASKMADAFGGLENMTAVTGVYYDNFYSEAEKATNVTRDVTKALADVGLQMPTTRGEFRALVEAQMALGESGTKAVAALLGVSGAFASVAGTYYDNFYSEAEKTANVTRDVTAALADVGLAMPKTRQEFRALVESQMALGDAGTDAVATLLGVSGAFASLHKSLEDTAKASIEAAKAERERLKALRETAQKLVDDTNKSLEDLKRGIKDDAFKANGGSVQGISVRMSEADSASRFATALDAAAESFAELEKLDLGSELSGYTKQIKAAMQSMKEMLTDNLAATRLKSGDAAGAMDAKMQAAISKPEMAYSNFTTAGAFNVAYAKQQAEIAKQLISQANASAITVSNFGTMLGYLNSFAQNDLIVNDTKQSFLAGVREASGIATTYVVRDAVQGLAGVLAKREVQATYGNTDTGLPAIAAAYAQSADMSKVEMINGQRYMGEVAIEYAKTVSNLNANFNRGKISADELEKSIGHLAGGLGDLAEYSVTPAQIVMSRVGVSASIANEGIKALNLYFGQLSTEAERLAEAAKVAAEPIAVVADVVGRMNSVSTVFKTSADAVISGFMGMTGAVEDMNSAIATMLAEGVQLSAEDISNLIGEASSTAGQDRYGLNQALTYGSDVRKGLLVAKGASIASETMTTAQASAVAEKMATNPVFDALTNSGIRDVAMLLDGLQAFDAASFEKVFIRLSDALKKGTLNEEQYAAMFDTSIAIFTDHDNKVKELTSTFNSLRDAARSLADRFLLDAGVTTLSGGQTLTEAQRQYDSVMSRALQGDITASGDLDRVTQNLLDIAKANSTNEQDYGRIFGGAIGDLRLFESLALPDRIPEAIENNAKTNAELIAEIKALREEIRAGNAQIASNTNNTNKSLQDFQVNGMPTVALI